MKNRTRPLPALTALALLPLAGLAFLPSGCGSDAAQPCGAASGCVAAIDAQIPPGTPPPTDAGAPTTFVPADALVPPSPQGDVRPRAAWTVFVYGHGDHNLSEGLAADLEEMNAAKLSPDVNVILLADWDASAAPEGSAEKFPSGTFWYRIRGNGQKAELIGQEGELDLDDPAVLSAAIAQAFKRYPAKRHGLVLWDHGGGWAAGFGGDTQNGTVPLPAGLAVETMAKAVRSGLAAAGFTGQRSLDFFAFDACLLGSTEVTAAFSDIAPVYIANAELDFGIGLDYAGAFSWLAANPGATAREFAVAESQLWDAHHKDATVADQLFRSHVAIDTEKFDALVAEFGRFAREARASGAGLGRAFLESVPSYIRSGNEEEDALYPPARDIGTLFDRLKSSGNPALEAGAARLAEIAGRARLGVVTGDLRREQFGVSILAGRIVDIDPVTFPAYAELASTWQGATGWGSLLQATQSSAAKGPLSLTAAPSLPAVPSQADPPRLAFHVGSAEAAMVEVALLAPDPANRMRMIHHGVIASGVAARGPQVAKWFGRWTVLPTIGGRALPVFAAPFELAWKGGKLTTPVRGVPGQITSGSGLGGAVIALVDDRGIATAMALEEEGEPTLLAPIALLWDALGPGTTFVPDVVIQDRLFGKMVRSPGAAGIEIDASAKIVFRDEAAPKGPYQLKLRVTDVWGNSGATSGDLVLEAPVSQ